MIIVFVPLFFSTSARLALRPRIAYKPSMSSYELQKLIHHVNRDPEARAEYKKDAGHFAERYALAPEEREAILSLDIRKLYIFGVHPLLLRPFTLVHGVSAENYSKALSGLE